MECDDDFADQSERAPEGKMPWSLFIRDHITQMVIEYINDLVIRDRVVMSSAYQGQSEFDSFL